MTQPMLLISIKYRSPLIWVFTDIPITDMSSANTADVDTDIFFKIKLNIFVVVLILERILI